VPSANNANEIQRFKFDTPSPDDSVLEAQKRATGSAESSSSQHAHSVLSSSRSASSQPQNLEATHAITEGKSAMDILPGPSSSSCQQYVTLHTAVAADQFVYHDKLARGLDCMCVLANPVPDVQEMHQCTLRARFLRQCMLPAALICLLLQMSKLHLHDHALANEAAEPSSKGTSRPASAGNQPQRPIQEYQLERDLQAACDALASAEQAQPKLHLVVLGHVDAGKSTLMGRLLHDLG